MSTIRQNEAIEQNQGGSPFKTPANRVKKGQDAHLNGLALAIFFILTIIAVVIAVLMDNRGYSDLFITAIVLPIVIVAALVMAAMQVARQWEKAVVLRLGKFQGLKGPGLFWIIPVIDTITSWIDHRVMVTPFSAEKTLTRDTVPVNVDAVLFWVVWDAEKAALEVDSLGISNRAARDHWSNDTGGYSRGAGKDGR